MKNKALREIYLWPTVMGMLISIGLIVALLEDGLAETMSNLLLSIPVFIMIYFYFFRGFKRR